ncbi:SAM-dependent methyltransferase [Natranaerobius thermophilus]|uniref:Precorrin-2 C20-methyltransferase n=1 Tax=Natranaerobius thermophilus (strain ATCC BAA-1301 / DSM 18059 / JW/NM-WN-LF) TaxID=457570 RepID=B2A0F6_NATTJ|nr:precorrin-2 C(20)-methyltransferase [Natranaerobius thermophilus]ACB84517.1 precorrin-2 C20-methyltransferase [Natranaerobius thermophilus JW/NM-WN-LF]
MYNTRKLKSGKLYAIGVGPGDPELLTLKAVRVLSSSDIIIAPKSPGQKKGYAQSIVKAAFKNWEWDDKLPPVETVEVSMNSSADSKTFTIKNSLQRKVLEKLLAGQNISFITLGDPMFYSTYRHLAQLIQEYNQTNQADQTKQTELIDQINQTNLTNQINGANSFNSQSNDAHIQVEVIPGIYSFSAISAKIGGIQLTFGSDKTVIVPVKKDQDYRNYLKDFETLVFLKVTSNFDKLVNQIKESQRVEEAVLVEKLGFPDEKLYQNILEVEPRKVSYLSTLIVSKNLGSR